MYQVGKSTAASRRSATSKEKELIPENETEEEMMARLRKKARKMMYNEKGVPYAPWMAKQMDEDVRFCAPTSYGITA